ncbi:unnamed protein product, partial [Mesorhabditis belari]|uniref:Uncharacterized protein n=1 Tax=Mesorhabditis belari TaxID=2138241 RepID=A0AAF3EZA2_9BILA
MLTISLIWQAVLPLLVFYFPSTLGLDNRSRYNADFENGTSIIHFPLFGGTTSSALLTWLMPPLPDCGYFAW